MGAWSLSLLSRKNLINDNFFVKTETLYLYFFQQLQTKGKLIIVSDWLIVEKTNKSKHFNCDSSNDFDALWK